MFGQCGIDIDNAYIDIIIVGFLQMEYSKTPGQQMEKSKTVTQNQVNILFARKEKTLRTCIFSYAYIFGYRNQSVPVVSTFCIPSPDCQVSHLVALYYPGP